jgi:DNA-directed RNA polymerase specialized sigma24 family protein
LFWKRGGEPSNGKQHASEADFCQLFEREMSRLFLLALMLTGDEMVAEDCFARSLESCSNSGRISPDWASRWATHNIIKNAIVMVDPAHRQTKSLDDVQGLSATRQRTLAAVLGSIDPLDRFVYVMSVLERYSDRECASYLGCVATEIGPARERATQAIAEFAEEYVPQCALRASA